MKAAKAAEERVVADNEVERIISEFEHMDISVREDLPVAGSAFKSVMSTLEYAGALLVAYKCGRRWVRIDFSDIQPSSSVGFYEQLGNRFKVGDTNKIRKFRFGFHAKPPYYFGAPGISKIKKVKELATLSFL